MPAWPQVTARQGAPRVDPDKQFASPMVLEFPATQLREMKNKEAWNVPGIREYRCEDVSFAYLRFTRQGKSKSLRFDIEGMVMVADSYDRFVTVRVEIMDGETVIARDTATNLDAEERKGKGFKLGLHLDEMKVNNLAAAEAPLIRVTMHVRKDSTTPWTPNP